MPVKYMCEKCRYETSRKSSYHNHLKSQKHYNNVILDDQNLYGQKEGQCFPSKKDGVPSEKDGRPSEKDGDSDGFYNNSFKVRKFFCRFCKRTIRHSNNIRRHERICKDRKVFETEQQLRKEKEKRFLTEMSKKQLEDELEELKEVKEDYMKLLKQIAQSKVKGNTMNMYYIINNFNDAYNFEDLMRPELTDVEKSKLDELEPLSGSIYVIENRCITDIDVKKRPIHCLDTARDKYLLRTNNAWVVDHKAKKIFSKVSSHIYKHYLLDPQNPKYSIDEILKNQQQLIHMEGKASQIKLMKDLNDKVYIKNIVIDDKLL